DEGALQRGDHGEALVAVAELRGDRGGPLLEDVGGRLAEAVVGAGDLERDGGDRAGVLVVGRLEGFAGAGEDGAHRVLGRCLLVVDSGDQRLEEGARLADHLAAEVGLAAGEVVVERAKGRVGLGDHLLEAGAVVALPTEVLGGGEEDAVAGGGLGGGGGGGARGGTLGGVGGVAALAEAVSVTKSV